MHWGLFNLRLFIPTITETRTGENPMGENQSTSIAIEILNKFGLPTALLLVVGYFIWGDIIKPIATNYQELLIEVRLNNTEIRKGMLDLGEENRRRIGKMEDQILENSELMGDGIQTIANANKEELKRIELKIDQLLSK